MQQPRRFAESGHQSDIACRSVAAQVADARARAEAAEEELRHAEAEVSIWVNKLDDARGIAEVARVFVHRAESRYAALESVMKEHQDG